MGLLELPDLRQTLLDIGTTLLCISWYNGLPCRTLPINLIHETVRRSKRVDNAAFSSAVSCVVRNTWPNGKSRFCTFSIWQTRYLGKSAKAAETYSRKIELARSRYEQYQPTELCTSWVVSAHKVVCWPSSLCSRSALPKRGPQKGGHRGA